MTTKPKSSDIHAGPGFRIRQTISRPDKTVIEAFSAFETPDISDLMNRLYTMDIGIKNVINNKPIFGPACTVKVFPGDNLMVHKALDIAQPGDIIVVDAGGSTMNGIIGDIIATKAKHRGILGFVIDGVVRDVPGMKIVGMPVYTRGTTPIGPLHRGPGEINFSVSCGGIVVNPGDIICGDENGVAVVHQEFAEEILARLIQQKADMANYLDQVQKGIFSNSWVDDLLTANRCVYLD
ncbi:MAG: RraA family protein [Chloroflexota bacterium]